MISRCSSPMPLMIVCAVSGSECTRNVGSSSESFASAMPSLSWSALVLLDRNRDDGVREAHRLENDRMRLIAQCVAGARVLEGDGGGDMAGAHVLELVSR